MNFIYMDNAAGTRLLEEVFDEMRPYFIKEFGNPSSIHNIGQAPREAIEQAREPGQGVSLPRLTRPRPTSPATTPRRPVL